MAAPPQRVLQSSEGPQRTGKEEDRSVGWVAGSLPRQATGHHTVGTGPFNGRHQKTQESSD